MERCAQKEHKGGCTLSRRRLPLTGNALVKLEVRLGLAEAIPVWHRLDRILLGGRA